MSQIAAWDAAWGQCYRYFGFSEREFDEEIASLRLAFYLANFGMYRASGKIRVLQLSGFRKIALECRRFSDLRDLSPKALGNRQSEVEKFLKELKSCLRNLGVTPTPTLVSKIALGTTACMPAYDRFAVAALREQGIIGNPSTKGLKQLFKLRKKDLSLFGVQYDSSVPFMRALDIGLLREGQRLTEKKKSKAP